MSYGLTRFYFYYVVIYCYSGREVSSCLCPIKDSFQGQMMSYAGHIVVCNIVRYKSIEWNILRCL